jgi:hypothetical protein
MVGTLLVGAVDRGARRLGLVRAGGSLLGQNTFLQINHLIIRLSTIGEQPIGVLNGPMGCLISS